MIIRNIEIVSFSQCHGRWNWKSKLPYSTWIRDRQLLCKLSIQSSRWIWFDESRSVGHFLFIIQHQIIFLIFDSPRYLHMILYLLSIYFFFIFLFLVFLFHFFVSIYLFIYLFIFVLFYFFWRFLPNHDFSTDRNWEYLELFVRT